MIRLELEGYQLCIEQYAPDQYQAMVNKYKGTGLVFLWKGMRHVKYGDAEREGQDYIRKYDGRRG